MKWNLRLAAANRDIWKPSELQRLLATEGLTISVAKAHHLWSGRVQKIDLSDLDTICAALRCGVEEILIPSTVKRVDDQREKTAPASSVETTTLPMSCTNDQDTPVGIRLLRDLHAVFEGVNALHSVTVLERLHQLHGRPWMHEYGRELTTRSLAYQLKRYGVVSVQVNLGGVNRRGYQREHLQQVWDRIPGTVKRVDDQREKTAPASSVETTTLPMSCTNDQDTPVGIRRLRDLHAVFEGVNALHSVTVLERLHQLHGRPWMHEYGRELTTRSLAYQLRPYGVVSVHVNLGGVSRRGYRRGDLQPAWDRYLPRPRQQEGGPGDHDVSA
ncbi:DUF3631 domain-containing protein [Actinoallomurus sp. NPDC050550]|uniref:DUF3631 domain-containing protein n=1 Tax=Actinoallomurus sp. NPDC050550 TaxID=3154937 RepID=UPI0033F6ED4F